MMPADKKIQEPEPAYQRVDFELKAFPYSSDSMTHLTELILKYQKHQTRARVFEQSLDALESSGKGTPPKKKKVFFGGTFPIPKTFVFTQMALKTP